MADHAGFCFGVRRAVDAIEEALDSGEMWAVGMPIHNPQEVDRLRARGLRVAGNEAEIPEGARVLIRAHGETRAALEALGGRAASLVDTTCPFVRRAQDVAHSLSEQGYHIVLLGDRGHPEVRGIMGYVDGSLDVVADEGEAGRLARRGRMALISQTTQREESLAAVASVLVRLCGELHVCNTVCHATVERQEAVKALAGRVDGVVLIGGRASANTGKLRDIAEAHGMDVLWVEDVRETVQNRGWFEGRDRIGIAAGASTPGWLITQISSEIARM